jgi:lysyl-tRNA synthetase class II
VAPLSGWSVMRMAPPKSLARVVVAIVSAVAKLERNLIIERVRSLSRLEDRLPVEPHEISHLPAG